MEEHKFPSQDHQIRRDMVAFLGGLSLFLSTIEYLFPKPVPFFRIGLANLPVLLGFGILNPREILVLGLLKVLGQGLVNGTLASYVFLFSLGGTAASIITMYGYYRLFPRKASYIGISLMGALASNLVQVWLSLGFIFGQSAWVIVPYFLAMGGATGLVMGVFSQIFATRSRWFLQFSRLSFYATPGLPGNLVPGSFPDDTERKKSPDHTTPPKRPRNGKNNPGRWFSKMRQKRRDWVLRNTNPRFLFVTGLVALVLFAFQGNLGFRIIQVLILFCVAEALGKHIRLGYFFILFVSITGFSLIQPAGEILYTFGSFTLTLGALRQGAFRALTLIGFVFTSLAMVQPHLNLPGSAGLMLARIFQYYEGFNHFRGEFRGQGFLATIDQVLSRIFPVEQILSGKEPLSSVHQRSSVYGSGGIGGVRRAGGILLIPAILILGLFVFMLVIDLGIFSL